jgi:hypothetical protein
MSYIAAPKQIKAVLDAGWTFPPSGASSSAWQIMNSISGSHAATIAMLNGTQWLGGELLGGPLRQNGAPVVLAQAMSGPLSAPLYVPGYPPPLPRGGVERLLGDSLLGSIVVMMVANLLMRVPLVMRARLEAARTRFGLGRTDADTLAAYAYLWGLDTAPEVFWIVPYSGLQNERVAEALMWYERANPGTLSLAIRGHQAAQEIVKAVIAQVLAGSVPADVLVLDRINAIDDRLSTNGDEARKILNIASTQLANQRWAAHHLIPFAVMRDMPDDFQRAVARSEWRMDSAENLIALPANWETFTGASKSKSTTSLSFQQSSNI